MNELNFPAARNEHARKLIAGDHKRIEPFISHRITSQEFWACAIVAVNKLREDTDYGSVLIMLGNLGQTGLRIGEAFGHAYALEFKNNGVRRAQLCFGYKGFLELSYANGFLAGVSTQVVLQGETLETWHDELGQKLRHPIDELNRPQPTKENVVGAYCTYQTRAGYHGVEFMPTWEIRELIKSQSSREQSLWNNKSTFPSMVRKSPLRRASKLWRLSPEMAAAVQLDEQEERGDLQALDNVDPKAPPITRSQEENARAMLDATLRGKVGIDHPDAMDAFVTYLLSEDGMEELRTEDLSAAQCKAAMDKMTYFTTKGGMTWAQLRSKAIA